MSILRRYTRCTLLGHIKYRSQNHRFDRDRFVLSKAWSTYIIPSACRTRVFPIDQLSEFGKSGSVFHEHPPKPGYIPGVEAATGSRHGLPMALGMAISNIKASVLDAMHR